MLQQLKADYVNDGKSDLFAKLNATLQGRSESQPYAQLADELGISVGAVKVAVHRMRKKYRQLLREHIGQTIVASEDLYEELRHLFSVLSGK